MLCHLSEVLEFQKVVSVVKAFINTRTYSLKRNSRVRTRNVILIKIRFTVLNYANPYIKRILDHPGTTGFKCENSTHGAAK